MPTFIDESGCCGFEPTSFPYFRLVAVWFPTGESAEACRESIEKVRQQLRLPEGYEFHYASKVSDAIREAFFNAVAGHEFCFVAVHFDKPAKPGALDKEGLFRACIPVLTENLLDRYQYAEELKSCDRGRPVRLAEKVIPDDNQDPFYLKVLKDYFFGLQSASGKSLVGDVKPARSHTDRLLQLADMICGAVGAHLGGNSRFFQLIRGNAIRVVKLPAETQEADGVNTIRPE